MLSFILIHEKHTPILMKLTFLQRIMLIVSESSKAARTLLRGAKLVEIM